MLYLHALATPHTENHSMPTTFSSPLDNQRVAQRHSGTPQQIAVARPSKPSPFYPPLHLEEFETQPSPLQSQMITSISAS